MDSSLGNTVGIAIGLRGLGLVAAAQGQATRAARLLGAAAHAAVGDASAPLVALEQEQRAALRATLGEAA